MVIVGDFGERVEVMGKGRSEIVPRTEELACRNRMGELGKEKVN